MCAILCAQVWVRLSVPLTAASAPCMLTGAADGQVLSFHVDMAAANPKKVHATGSDRTLLILPPTLSPTLPLCTGHVLSLLTSSGMTPCSSGIVLLLTALLPRLSFFKQLISTIGKHAGSFSYLHCIAMYCTALYWSSQSVLERPPLYPVIAVVVAELWCAGRGVQASLCTRGKQGLDQRRSSQFCAAVAS